MNFFSVDGQLILHGQRFHLKGDAAWHAIDPVSVPEESVRNIAIVAAYMRPTSHLYVGDESNSVAHS